MNKSVEQPVTYDEVVAARATIRGAVDVTPCPRSYLISQLLGCDAHCKLDYLQHTSSFKERGVANALAHLTGDERARGVIAASAGNHALALAHHGKRLNAPVTVVMPLHAPLVKVNTCRGFGAEVIQHGEDFREARTHAQHLAADRGLTYVHGFDDRHVIAGQGTIALEVLEQAPGLDAILVPVGGGGLIAGVAVAVKAMRPAVEVIGVEAARAPSFTAALQHGEPIDVPVEATLADGLAVGRVGGLAFRTARPHVDRVLTVEESDLALAVLRLLELEKAVVEGAGAAPLAAMLSGQLPHLKGKHVAMLLCGGNIDPLVLRRVIEFGLSVDGRLCRLTATVRDRPGGLALMTRVLAESGASIQEIRHERIFAGPDVSRVEINAVLETRDRAHLERIVASLQAVGIEARV